MKAEVIADYQCVTGEEAHWNAREQRLYWLDNETGRMFRYDPASGHHEQFYQGDIVGSYTFQEDGALLLFMARGAVRIWREGRLTTVVEEMPQERDSRFNAALADPVGRVFCGTMPSKAHPSRLYRLDLDGSIHQLLDEVGEANQMAFSADRRRFHLTDTKQRSVFEFDYDAESGTITHQRLFVRVPDAEGKPDGLTLDADGCLWSTRWGGGCVVRFTPDGAEDRRVTLPVPLVSSMSFGGANMDEAYVTTAGGNKKAEQGASAGALFRVPTGVRGVPSFCSRMGC